MALFILLATVLAVTVIAPATADVDSTRVAETKGSDVVDAVVDLIRSNCIFSEDRLFLRRLASVESGDGSDPKTYRAGYDGGIWQVDREMFDATVGCSGIQSYCNIISQPPFNITWAQVTWSDLRKPLYSGLAAALYILKSYASSFPAEVERQAAIWSTYYRPGQSQSVFVQRSANATQYDCSNPMDVAYILDSSGSVSNQDFSLSLNGTASFAEAMDVPHKIRLSLTTFDDLSTVRFWFDTYSNKSQIVSAIRNIIRTSGGTNTAEALNRVRTSVFPTARNNSKHVAVLVTDGQSNSFPDTAAAAELLRKSGVVVFALGIGNYRLSELQAIASEPVCSHVFTLSDFSFINSIIYEIKRSTCQAPKVITTPSTNVSQSTTEPYTISVNTSVVGPSKTIGFDVRCGTLDIYVSFTNPRPSSAFFSEHYTAEDGRPAYLTSSVLADGRQVYITVVGKELPTSIAELQKCYNFSYTVSVVDKPWEIMCCKDGVCRTCTDSDLLQQKDVYNKFCSGNNFGYDNPCTLQALSQGRDVFPYPYDSSKFIRCDALGNPYVTLCPSGQIFDSESLSCGNKGSDIEGSSLSPYNPCTPANLRTGLFYYVDPTSKTRFIQCDVWGNAWQQTCPDNLEWNQASLTCDYPKAASPVASNPCTTAALSAGQYYHPHPCNHNKFIQCDNFGKATEKTCPTSLFYDPTSFVCVRQDPQPGTSC